ncbi:amino acid permease [Candidatus Methylacidiphilum infernorum]|uniref:Amino acid permease n=1 Tax=Candidatus Methylacidiphilum infernorum TaxID=511746 RepID=A0ABX7PX95_9BACT|nr:amino acid permease [Candidatus Methylacidiphilum infernorum]QSR87293.1 amino acid permease [Candidatus Methylacidiphilum infernorum]
MDLLKPSEKQKLAKTLNVFDLFLLGVGAIIGSGIFVLTGVAAAREAGPALSISFVFAGIVCLFTAFAYAEFSSVIHSAGSAYAYAYRAIGRFAGWITGWCLILAYLLTGAVVSIGWSAYMVDLLKAVGIVVPFQFAHAPSEGGMMNVPAMGIVFLIALLLSKGVKESAWFNHFIVGLKLAVIFLFIFVASRHLNMSNWVPFMPFGWKGVMGGAAFIFFAYLGFDAVSTTAEEAKNPGKDLPLGIIGSLVFCTFLYILVGLLLTGVVSYKNLDVKDPVTYALMQVGERLTASIVSVGALGGITSALLVNMYGQSRIFFAMSRDRFLPPFLEKLHPKFNTPYRIILGSGLIVALLAGFTPIHTVAELTNVGALTAFIMVSVSVLVMRKKNPELIAPFRAPGMPWTGILSILSCFFLIIHLSKTTLIAFAGWLCLGTVLYCFYWNYPARKEPKNIAPL